MKHRTPRLTPNYSLDLSRLRGLLGGKRSPPSGDQYVIRPTKWRYPKKLLGREEIAKQIDDRSFSYLKGQIDEQVEQVFLRAAIGDESAIRYLLVCARQVIQSLELLNKAQPKILQAVAAKSANWPVLLSDNLSEVKRAQEFVHELGVATQYETQRKRGQKSVLNSLWTRLADEAVQACCDTKEFVPLLKDHCKGVRPQRESVKLWGTPVNVSIYNLDRDKILIADWEEDCVKLSEPITESNYPQLWSAVKYYVMEYWYGGLDEYAEALQAIGQSQVEEWRRRNMAFDRVEQALRGLTGLR